MREPVDTIIFIVGSGRSGTTFLAKLLDSHPDVIYRHEPDAVLVERQIPFLPEAEDLTRYCDQAKIYVQRLCKARHVRVSGHRPIFSKNYRTWLGQQAFRASVYSAKAAERISLPALAHKIKIPDFIDPAKQPDAVYVVKSVNSVGRTRLLSDANPRCPFLHIVRHPCGVIASVLRGAEKGLIEKVAYLEATFRLNDSSRYPYTLEDMKRRSFEEQYAYCWMVLNQKVHDEMKRNPLYTLIEYEDLCRHTVTNTLKILSFCGLERSEQTERFIAQLSASKRSRSGYYDVVRSPEASIDTWRDFLSKDQADRIADVVRHAPIGRQFVGD